MALSAFAFAAAGLAVATFMRELHHNQYVQLVMLPMFLFSATFYPLSIYPTVIHDVVAALPLYQSINLLRGLTLGEGGGGPSFSARFYLGLFGLFSVWLGSRRLTRLVRALKACILSRFSGNITQVMNR